MPIKPGNFRSHELAGPVSGAFGAALRGVLLPAAIALAVIACSAASAPPPGPTGPPASSPTGSPPGSVASVDDAVAAVGRFDSNFLGYRPRDPNVIGQSAWVEAKAVADGYELTFFRGSGDCPAGCIERSFIKFFVGRDGQVEKRCEWQEGQGASATPC